MAVDWGDLALKMFPDLPPLEDKEPLSRNRESPKPRRRKRSDRRKKAKSTVLASQTKAPVSVTPPAGGEGRRENDRTISARIGGDRKSDNLAPGVMPEKRAERQYVRVQLPMEVVFDGRHYPGRDISLDGFAFEGFIDTHQDKAEAEFELRILFRGYTLTITAIAALVRFDEINGISSYRMVRIGDEQFDILRRLIRAYLSGQLVTFEGFILANDMQTKRKRQPQMHGTLPKSWPDRWLGIRRLAVSASAVGLALSMVVLLAFAIAERMFVTTAEYAAITAPRIELRASRPGRIANHSLHVGDQLARDDAVVAIVDRELDSEIEYARDLLARLPMSSGTERLPMRAPGRFSRPPQGAALIDQSNSLPQVGFGVDARLERTRLALLEWYAAENRFHSPCDCRIETIGRPGDWVARGDTVVSLVDLAPSQTRIEASVSLQAAMELVPGMSALAILPAMDDAENGDESQWIWLEVEEIVAGKRSLDRVGWPEIKEPGRALVRLIAKESLPAQAIGRPLEVRFSKLESMTEIGLGLSNRIGELGDWFTSRLLERIP